MKSNGNINAKFSFKSIIDPLKLNIITLNKYIYSIVINYIIIKL